MEIGLSWHQRSSWTQPRTRADSLSCLQKLWVQYRKIQDFPGNTVVWIVFSFHLPSVFSVVSRGGFLDVCSAIFWKVLLRKHAQHATSVLSEIFQIRQNFVWSKDAVTPLPGLLACRPWQASQDLVHERGSFHCCGYSASCRITRMNPCLPSASLAPSIILLFFTSRLRFPT